MEGWLRRHEAGMGLGGLAPLRALLLAAALLAATESALLAGGGFLDPGSAALHGLGLMGPWAMVARFLPALCLLPLAARLPTAAVALPYLAVGAAMPLLTHWAGHPYDLGLLPRPREIALSAWLSGIPTVAYGGILAVLARKRGAPSTSPSPYRAALASVLALVAIGLPAVALAGGTFPDAAAVAALAPLLAGALKGALLGGALTGMAAYVLSSGWRGRRRAVAYAAAVAVAGPAAATGGHAGVWAAGLASFTLAVALAGMPARLPRGRWRALTGTAAGAT